MTFLKYYVILDTEEFSDNLLLCIDIDPMGNRDRIRQLQTPPQERVLVVGIGKDGRIVIVCPSDKTATASGWHERCKAHAMNALGATNLGTVVEGRIYGEHGQSRKPGQRLNHTVAIFKRNPRDISNIHQGGMSPVEGGFLHPEAYVDSHLAQTIMRIMHADRLEIVYARPSLSFKEHA